MFEWLIDRYWRWKHDWHHRRMLPWERIARRRGFFPAYADWSGGIAVDRAGGVWRSEDSTWLQPAVVAEPAIRFAAQGVAVRRYPELASVIPIRQAEDPNCPTCHGVGYPRDLPPKLRYWIMCQCGGLGWVPSSLAQVGTRQAQGLTPPAV